MATAPSPNDLTRQQLDELDALLQRMLSVPLAPPDTPMPVGDAPPLPPSWRIDPPAPAGAASQPHLVIADPAPAIKSEPPAVVAKVPAPAPVPVVPEPKSAPVPVAAPAPKPVVSVSAPVRTVAPVPAAPPVPLPLLPLVAVNAVFDAACGLLGPPGRVLRSGFFKHIYGCVGLGLLLYTAAHVAQAEGWITLPVTLPWPR